MRKFRQAFTLIELLVVCAILFVLASLLVPWVQSLFQRADAVGCIHTMGQLGRGIHLYSVDRGEFPRSSHSAAAFRQPGWSSAIAPFLALPESKTLQDWGTVFNRHFRCRSDTNTDVSRHSYALNVYFELNPNGDDYVGSPAVWRTPHSVPRPSATILLAENRPVDGVDHLMCHQWSSSDAAINALANRHQGHVHFLFVDGHVEARTIESTFDPDTSRNLWNPSLAKE